MSQWGEVKKKTKDRSQSKAKDSAITSADTLAPSTRGGRGRGGSDTARGTGRGRGASDRSRGASRAGRGGRAPPSSSKVNGTTCTTDEGWGASAPSGTWDESAPADASTSPLDSGWEHVSADSTSQAPEEAKPSSKPDGSRSWASMFAKPKQAPAPPKAPKSAPANEAPIEPPNTAPSTVQDGNMQGLPPPVTINDTSEIPITPPATELVTSEQAADLTPTKDDLTETNLEKLPDNSGPVTSATAASTAASTLDQRGFSGTPLLPAQPVTTSRPPMGGYATTAYKATGMPGRTASYQRRVLEQQEAVVMPGKHAVDKAAVQFGSMGLNGTPEDVDVDSDREDPETRVQPPQHSPVAPRASLPPAPLQQQPQGLPQAPVQEPHATPRQAPGLPPVSQPLAAQAPLQQQSAAEGQPSLPSSYPPYDQFGGDRYAQPAAPPEAPPSTKSYEPFGQQLQQSQQQYDPFSNAGASNASNDSRQFPNEKYGSGPSNASSYYTSDDQRSGYQNNQYGGYGQHQPSLGQEPAGPQQRSGSALGSSAPGQPSQYPTAAGRFGQGAEGHSSGQSTPYGSMSNQQSNTHPHHMSQQGQGPGQQGGYGYGGYPYGAYYSSYNMNQVSAHSYGRDRPGFEDAHRFEEQYLTQTPQYGYGGQGGYGGGPFGGAGGGKGLYGQHQHPAYGMSPQTSHDQHHSTASPANAGPFGQQLPGSGRDSAANSGGLGGFGARSGSAQPNDSMPEIFGRSQSNYHAGQGLGGNTSGNDDGLRGGYGDPSKMAGGPSPAMGQSGVGRPGSAANPPSVLPPQDARYGQPGGYGGYPNHSNYGGGPAAGGHGSTAQTHQGGGGGYGGGYGGNFYGNSNRGGWGASYGH